MFRILDAELDTKLPIHSNYTKPPTGTGYCIISAVIQLFVFNIMIQTLIQFTVCQGALPTAGSTYIEISTNHGNKYINESNIMKVCVVLLYDQYTSL